MANRLKDYFPLIRERKEVLEESTLGESLVMSILMKICHWTRMIPPMFRLRKRKSKH